MQNDETLVVVRRGNDVGTIIALFPELPADYQGTAMRSSIAVSTAGPIISASSRLQGRRGDQRPAIDEDF